MKVHDCLLVVLEQGRLDTSQIADCGLDDLGDVLNLESQRKLVLNQAGLEEDLVDVEVLLLGVFFGLGENMVEGLQALGEGGNGKVVKRGARHGDGLCMKLRVLWM